MRIKWFSLIRIIGFTFGTLVSLLSDLIFHGDFSGVDVFSHFQVSWLQLYSLKNFLEQWDWFDRIFEDALSDCATCGLMVLVTMPFSLSWFIEYVAELVAVAGVLGFMTFLWTPNRWIMNLSSFLLCLL